MRKGWEKPDAAQASKKSPKTRLQGGRVWDADLAGGGEKEMKFGMWQTVNEFSHVHIRLWFYSLI